MLACSLRAGMQIEIAGLVVDEDVVFVVVAPRGHAKMLNTEIDNASSAGTGNSHGSQGNSAVHVDISASIGPRRSSRVGRCRRGEALAA